MKKSEITKRLNIIQDCINDIRLGWKVGMNISVLKAEIDEFIRKFLEDENE